MKKRLITAFASALLMIAGCSPATVKESLGLPSLGLEPTPVQKATFIQGLALDGSVQRDQAIPLKTVRLVDIPKDMTDTEAEQLLGDGTLYRLELDRLGKNGATLVRFDDVAGELRQTRIPLVAPAGQQIRTDAQFGLGLRVATSTPGVQMDRHQQGTVWWEEDGPNGRLIEFRIDGDRATMLPPGGPLDDPKAPVARRFNRNPDREVPWRFTTGAVDAGPGLPSAYLGGSGFSIALARTGNERTEAFLESPAFDLPHIDVAEPAAGLLTVTVGYITSQRGYATQVTYDSSAKKWQDHRPLVEFPEAQGVEVADVGPNGALVVLGLPWNVTQLDPETGLYWVRRYQPVRHLLQRVRKLQTVTLPDGFIALFEDEASLDRPRDDARDMLVLRAQFGRLALYTFPNPGPCFSSHFAWLGENRFAATFCGDQLVLFEVPDVN